MSETALAGNPSNYGAMMNALSGSSSAGNASNLNEISEMLLQQYGEGNVQQSVSNIAAEMIGGLVMKLIDGMGMPDFMADQAKGALSDVLAEFTGETPDGLDSQVRELLGQGGSEAANGGAGGGVAASAAAGGGAGAASGGGGAAAAAESESAVENDVGSIMKQASMDEMEKASEGGDGGGTNKNWLVVLARALGSAAGKHLKSMIELGEKMGAIDSTEDPEQFAMTQSEFQAAAQIFKMFQEVIGTLIKSIGEGLSTVARKQ